MTDPIKMNFTQKLKRWQLEEQLGGVDEGSSPARWERKNLSYYVVLCRFLLPIKSLHFDNLRLLLNGWKSVRTPGEQ